MNPVAIQQNLNKSAQHLRLSQLIDHPPSTHTQIIYDLDWPAK